MPAQLPRVLSTTVGELPLYEYRLSLGGRTWTILHTGAVLSHEDEEQFLRGDQPRSKISMTSMRPPQHGHGREGVCGSLPSTASAAALSL